MGVTPLSLSFQEKVVVVTGAAQGIGAATAEAFAGLGAHLALCDRDGDGLARTAQFGEALGRRTVTATLDVRDAAAVETFVDRIIADLGPIHVLVNNAGGGFAAPFLDVSAKGEAALVAENFTSVTSFIRQVVPAMPDGGAIVNVTSIEAHRAAPGYAVYSAMKAAVANLTKSLALELGPLQIRVNCVAPDVIPTPGIGEPPVSTPLPVAGHVDDVAGAVAFLASGLARFITGTTLHVDGGNHAAAGWRRGPDGTFSL